MEVWERYESLVDDRDAFRAAARRPLPTIVRVNPIKTTPARARAALESDGYAVTTRNWNEYCIEVDTDTPGRTWPYQHGWVHGQEEISQLPATLFSFSPGDVVVDLAAAPGGKATQIAGLLGTEGTVIANDVNLGRLTALRSNADRLGVSNAIVTNRDGRQFSLKRFDVDAVDHVLVDAPCSGEGTIRKGGPQSAADQQMIGGLVPVQEALLRRAIAMTRPGGTVVYSTCTFAPEENERVLDAVLADGGCSIVPIDPGLPGDPGITAWKEARYDPAVRRARRYYPHRHDTGGFFCAKLQVTE